MMPRVLKAMRGLAKASYLLLALVIVAGMAIIPMPASATDPPLDVKFTANGLDLTFYGVNVEQCELVTFTNLTIGGKHPYTKAEWDFDGDGVFDLTVTGTEEQVMESVTYAYGSGGCYYPKLQMTDRTPTTSYMKAKPPFAVIVISLVATWILRWGLDEDPAAVNIWTYPGWCVKKTLADLDATMPDGLLIWHYGGPTLGWRFYKQGWGDVNTLTTLIPGEGYIGIVPTATGLMLTQPCPD